MEKRIFLSNRYILFPGDGPYREMPGDLVAETGKRKAMRVAFGQFKHNDHYRRLVIPESSSSDQRSTSFETFCSLFKPIAAAGGLVSDEEGSLLFIFRNNRWDLPKGKIHLTRDTYGRSVIHSQPEGDDMLPETPSEAAIREVMEETGLKHAEIVSPLPSTYHLFYEKGHYWLKTTWWFRMKARPGQKLIPQTEEGISKVEWISRKDLKNTIRQMWPSLHPVLREAGFQDASE